MAFDESKYRKGYSIGVGGVVIHNKRALLVRRTRGEETGEWAIPGGFVEQKEKIEDAIIREVIEETGVEAQVKGLFAVRNRLYKNENSVYFIFLLEATEMRITLEKSEVDKAGFFSLSEINELKDLQALTKTVVTKVLTGKAKILTITSQDEFPDEKYSIFD
jgi:ADP-ribose pyrophosphatase YjhB (NUDIX family)